MNKTKIISLTILIIYIISFGIVINLNLDTDETTTPTDSDSNVILEFFLSVGDCGDCEEAKKVVEPIEKYYGENISVIRHPVDTQENKVNLTKMREEYNLITYPSIVIYNQTDKSNFLILDMDETDEEGNPYLSITYENLANVIDNYLSGNQSIEIKDEQECIIKTPLGNFSYCEISLPVMTIILGLADSVNPCSFFVLLFLLSLLLYTKSRKRMLLIGSIFVFFSGFIYFLLMVAILETVLIIQQQLIIAYIAGFVAIVFGLLNIKDFIFFKKGPSASIPESQKPKLYNQMRKLVRITSVPSVIVATIILAISANTVELLCSFGLPLIYTGTILPLYSLSGFENYLYILLYNIIYIIPLIIIVLIVVITLGRFKLSEFQGRQLKLFSGLMILSLGEILIFKITLLENIFVSIGIILVSFCLTIGLSFIWKRDMKKEISD